MPIQIRRMKTDDPHTRCYFSHTELVSRPEQCIRGMRVRSPVLKAVLEIPGVAMASVQTYNIIVTKPPTFEWSEIEPSLLRLLSAFNLGAGALEKAPSNADNEVWIDEVIPVDSL